jgi:hypothetical protein
MSAESAKTLAKPLSNRTIAVSVSETPDLDVLGMLEGEDRVFLGALLTPLVYSDARIAYGGRVEHPGKTNFTLEISGQLAETYRRLDTALGKRPMIQYLRADDAQNAGSEKLFAHALRLGGHSEIRLLWGETTIATMLPAGSIVDVHIGNKAPIACCSGADLAAIPQLNDFFTRKGDNGLAAMRRATTAETDARITLGGAVAKTAEGTSGIISEGLAALEAGKPLLIIGGVGGSSRDMAARLGLIEDSEIVRRDEATYIDNDNKPSKERYDAQLKQVDARRAAFQNMITQFKVEEPLRRLAISESHLEIGALVLEILSKWLP